MPDSAETGSSSSFSPADTRPVRVAIVGGGCAGIAAAWELSKLPGYDVSVFERSWRLGGKGASGRASDGRIEEHGLHLWLGFYENAFRMIRECYREVGDQKWGPANREHPLAHGSFEDAFLAEPHIGVAGRKDCSNELVVWSGLLPPAKGLPGDSVDAGTNPFTLASYLQRCVELLKTLMLSVIGPAENDVPRGSRPERRSAIDELLDGAASFEPTKSPEVLVETIAARLRDGSLTLLGAALQALSLAENLLQDFNHSPQAVGATINFLKALTSQARKQLGEFVTLDEDLRWKSEIIDLVMTIAYGLYRDRVLFERQGLDAINHMDYRAWLKKHGATKDVLESRFIAGIYDLVFAYEKGDTGKPQLAAGVALRGALRMFFTYRGAMFWRMRSGMGDTVFAPLYKVMTSDDRKGSSGEPLRPVNFYFLHALERVEFDFTSKDRRFVTRLLFSRPDGPTEKPISRALDAFGCWPDSEDLILPERLTEGATVLDVGEGSDGFDAVIFAMGREDFARLIKNSSDGDELPNFPEAWRSALAAGQTVGTSAAQVWLSQDLEGLGWFREPGIITALGALKTPARSKKPVQPDLQFDTWADMTHTLPSERAWRRAHQVAGHSDDAQSVAYFCGVVPDGLEQNPGRALEATTRALNELMSDGMRSLWPAAFENGGSARDLEVARHTQVNLLLSDRYSLSLPGTIADRLSPLDRSVLNMTVAGDWTACGLDAGCVEGAVISGFLAAHAITGATPSLESIVGYDHP